MTEQELSRAADEMNERVQIKSLGAEPFGEDGQAVVKTEIVFPDDVEYIVIGPDGETVTDARGGSLIISMMRVAERGLVTNKL